MAKESRSGGYDRSIEDERKKALGSKTQQSVGAQAIAQPGAMQAAPQSIGELMTPSAGREVANTGDPNDEEFNRRVEVNRTFLSSPETKAQLQQFAVSLMVGNTPGQALAKAITLPQRAAVANAKLAKEQAESERADIRLQLELQRFGMDKEKLSEEKAQKDRRKALFASLKVMDDDKLLQVANELAGEGDNEGANLALRMMKSQDQNLPDEIERYMFDIQQGYKGTLMQWRQDNKTLTIMEGIRQKLAAGMPLSPGEQQVYDDAINTDVLTKIIMSDPEMKKKLQGGGAVTSSGTPAPEVKTEGTSGNVPFKVVQ